MKEWDEETRLIFLCGSVGEVVEGLVGDRCENGIWWCNGVLRRIFTCEEYSKGLRWEVNGVVGVQPTVTTNNEDAVSVHLHWWLPFTRFAFSTYFLANNEYSSVSSRKSAVFALTTFITLNFVLAPQHNTFSVLCYHCEHNYITRFPRFFLLQLAHIGHESNIPSLVTNTLIVFCHKVYQLKSLKSLSFPND